MENLFTEKIAVRETKIVLDDKNPNLLVVGYSIVIVLIFLLRGLSRIDDSRRKATNLSMQF